MPRIAIATTTLSIVIEETLPQKSDFEVLVARIELLIKTVDPRNYDETRANYSVFYEKLFMALAHHIRDYADMAPLETMSMYDLLIEEINSLKPKRPDDFAL